MRGDEVNEPASAETWLPSGLGYQKLRENKEPLPCDCIDGVSLCYYPNCSKYEKPTDDTPLLVEGEEVADYLNVLEVKAAALDELADRFHAALKFRYAEGKPEVEEAWQVFVACLSDEKRTEIKTQAAALDEAEKRIELTVDRIVSLEAALDDARAALERIRTLTESWRVIAASPTAFNRQFQVGVALALAGALKTLDGNEAEWDSYLPALASIESRLQGATDATT